MHTHARIHTHTHTNTYTQPNACMRHMFTLSIVKAIFKQTQSNRIIPETVIPL